MNFFDNIHETQITRRVRQPRPARQPRVAAVPLYRRLFPVDQDARAVARAAVAEVLG